MSFKLLTLALVTLSLALAPLRAQHDPGEMTPSTYRGVPLKYGSVDAISGSLDLKVPLGPRLPGRLPWGFTWTYESHNSTHQTLGGEFRPVVWPRTDLTGRFNYTVLVNGGAISFAHNFFIQDMDAQALLNQRVGDDLGFADAMVDANLQGQGAAFGPLHTEVHPSTDGTKFLIISGWPTKNGDPKVLFGKRMTVLDGTTTIWTHFQGVTHVLSAHGDHLVISETGLSYKLPPAFVDNIAGTITIQSQNTQGHALHMLTMTVTTNSVVVTNSMGYPEVNLACSPADRIRGYAEDYGHSGYLSWDYGLVPTSMTMDGQVTTFSWTSVYLENPNRTINWVMFNSITHPNGLVESVGYGPPIKRYSDYAFNPNTGQWMGFTNTSSWISYAYQYWVINQVVQNWNGQGKQVQITRVGPDWVESANPAGNPISRTDHVTTIRTFDSPSGYGAFRDVILTHFPLQTTAGVTWGAPGASDSAIAAAYLFVTSAIQKVDFAMANGTIYKTVHYGNYDMMPTFSWALGVGIPNPMNQPAKPILFWDFPGVPSPGVAVVSQPNLPSQAYTLQRTSNGKAATTQNHAIPNGGGASAPWGPVSNLGGPVDTTKTASLVLSPWLQPLIPTQANAISGWYLQYLREFSGSTADLGTVSTQYDTFDRPTRITSTVETDTTVQQLSYSGLNPSPDTATTFIDGLPFSGRVGKRYTYGPGPQYWKTSETDLLTGQTTCITPDDQGREIEKVDPNGISTSTRYDSWGRLRTQTTHGVDTVTKTYDYDNAGLWMKETTTVAGRTLITTTTYDGFGRTILVTQPDGSFQLMSYNGFGEKVTQSPWFKPGQTNYGVTTWTYDGKGRMIRETDPQGRLLVDASQEPAWNGYGVLTLTKDDRGFSHQTLTDLLGQKSQAVDPAGNMASFSYNAQGKLTRTVFAGQTRRYTFSPRGWMTSRTEPEEGKTSYGDFTAWGFPILTKKEGRCECTGSTVTLATELDELGRPMNLWRIYAEGRSDQLKAYAYDPRFVTQLSTVQSFQPNGTLTESYQYDDWGRPAVKSLTDEAGASFSVSQTLDGVGNVASLTYPAGGGMQPRTQTLDYDAHLRPLNVNLGTLRGHMDYDQVSGTQVTQTLTYGNGATSRQVFEKGELSLVEHRTPSALLESSALAWTAGGLLMSRGADGYDYDALGRLTTSLVNGWPDPAGQAPTPSLSQAFTYDAAGNRTGVMATPQNTGRPDEALSWTANYDSTNSIPAWVQGPDNNFLRTGAVYDNFGRLTSILAIPGNPDSLTNWKYDDEGRIVQENAARFLLDAQGLRFRRLEADGTTKYVVYGFNREPLSTFVLNP